MTKQSRPALGQRAISEFNPLTSDSSDLSRGTQTASAGQKVVSGKRLALGGVAPLSPFLPLPAARLPQPSDDEAGEEETHSHDMGMSRAKSSLGHGSSPAGSHARQHRAVTMPRSEAAASTAPAPLMIRSYSMPVATQQAYDAARKAEVLRRSGYSTTQYCSTPRGPRTPLSSVTTFDMNMTPMTTDRLANSAYGMLPDEKPALDSTMKRPSYRRGASSEAEEADEIRTPRAISPLVSDLKDTHITNDSTNDYFTSTHRTAHLRSEQHQDITFTIHPDHLAPPLPMTLA